MNAAVWWRSALAILALSITAPAVVAQGYNGPTLDKIREHGAIYLGYREAAVPFSYLVGDDVVGYSMDLCNRIVDSIKTQIGNPALKVVPVPVTGSSRLLMLITGIVDLECGATANTKIRQQAVDFSVTTFVSGVKAVVRKNSGIETAADLGGKTVVTTTGSGADRAVKAALAKRNATVNFKAAATHAGSLAMLVSGQADAFVVDDAAMAESLALFSDADKLKRLDENFSFEPYGIVLRKNDPPFKKLVDTALIELMKSGEVEKLHYKWFLSPIPPKNVNLQIPMNDMFKELLRNPNDKGI